MGLLDAAAELYDRKMIKKLHHSAYRCRDSEETRAFYEDFLGLPLVNTLSLRQSKTGREIRFLHTFYALDDGSCLAFFEVPDASFEFKRQADFDLHIALEVSLDDLHVMFEKGKRYTFRGKFKQFSDTGFAFDKGLLEFLAYRPLDTRQIDLRVDGGRIFSRQVGNAFVIFGGGHRFLAWC